MPTSYMPTSSKNKLKLIFHPGKLEANHAKSFFYEDSSLEAVYVIDSHPEGSQIHYIHRADKLICALPMSDSIDNLVAELGCVEQYQESKNCLLPEITKAHLQIISDKTGHVHKPDYVLNILKSFKKLEYIHDFDSNDIELYHDAITAYENFIYSYCEDILTSLNIMLPRTFYSGKLLTCAKRDQKEDSILNAQLDVYLNTQMDRDDPEIVAKLNNGKSHVDTILSDENIRSIIKGIYKLEWLLSLPKNKPIWSEYFIDFFHSGRNLLVDFLLKITAESNGLNQDEIKSDLVSKGTGEQQYLIATLKKECQGYLNHLEKELQVNLAIGQVLPSIYETTAPKLAPKHRATQNLISILSDETTTASEKITKFGAEFSVKKETLSQHRDGPALLFLKRTALFLSSFFLGAGLIYSYATTGSCNFFKSKGELAADKIEAYLPSTLTTEFH